MRQHLNKMLFKFADDNIFNKFNNLKTGSYLRHTIVPFDWLIDHAYMLMIGAWLLFRCKMNDH